jgi:hypothetical protein
MVLIIMILYKIGLNLGMSIFSISDVKDYIYTIMDYVIYTMNDDDFYIQLNNYKLNELPYVYFESNFNKRVGFCRNMF